jgi:hypothetical protein
MLFKTVPGIALCKLRHQTIAPHLRQDRCGRYLHVKSVATHNGFLGEATLDALISVHEDEISLDSCNRELHRQSSRLKDVDFIDPSSPDGND